MNTVTLGIRNAFRNVIRSVSIIIILGLSIGLSLVMLIARQTVDQKIQSVKSSIGNTVTIAPAGYSAFSQENNALTTSQLSGVASLKHVTNVSEVLTDRLTTIGSSTPSFGNKQGSTTGQTSLTSPVTLNQNGGGSGGGHFFIAGGEGGSVPTNFSLPITIVGTNTPTTLDGSTLTIASGKTISGTQNADDAMISSAMASKNNLKVGSTFTAYSSTLTVTGIFSSSTQGDNNTIIVSLPTEQSLSGQSGDVTSAVATVDSLDNLSSVTTAIKNKLGSAADVTSSEQQADETVQPLNSVKSVAVYSLIGAVIAGSVIILLTMIMIVRERRREIGVLKAIGATNARIIGQFMAEAVTLTVLGALVGMVIGIAGSNPVTHALVNSSSTGGSTNITLPNGGTVTTSSSPGGGGGGRFFGGLGGGHLRNSYNNLHAIVGWDILLYGLGVAILIAIIGSAFASSMIAKIRPSEVMRTE